MADRSPSELREAVQDRWLSQSRPTHGALAEKRRLADAMRDVIEHLVTSDAPEEELRVAADRLEAYAARLRTHPRSPGMWGTPESATAGSPGGFFDFSPLIGLANPLAPPIRITEVGSDRVRAEARFGSAYEGPPGHVHGGYVAAAFDEVLGFAQTLTGRPGMTGTLTIRYRRPTPLHTDLVFEARVKGTEGRKILAEGRCLAGERLCAEAEAIFVSVQLDRMRQMAEARNARNRGE